MFAKKPNVQQVELSRNYSFMYENFVLATQTETYLLLGKNDRSVYALRFDSPNCRYGGPNDEAHGGHPLTKYGLGIYGLYEVENSPWIAEMKVANRVHPNHSDSLFEGKKHYVACFKDVKFESVRRSMSEVILSQEEVVALVIGQLNELDTEAQ
jgi:hypothetical protein